MFWEHLWTAAFGALFQLQLGPAFLPKIKWNTKSLINGLKLELKTLFKTKNDAKIMIWFQTLSLQKFSMHKIFRKVQSKYHNLSVCLFICLCGLIWWFTRNCILKVSKFKHELHQFVFNWKFFQMKESLFTVSEFWNFLQIPAVTFKIHFWSSHPWVFS